MTDQFEIREDTANKYWPFQVWNVTKGWKVRTHSSMEDAQKDMNDLVAMQEPGFIENSVAWQVLSQAEEDWQNRFETPLPEPIEPALPEEIEIESQETVGTIIEYKGQQWLVTACTYLSHQDVIDAEEINDVVLSVGWHSHLVKVHPSDKLLPTLAELVQTGEAHFTSSSTVLFADEEYAVDLSDLAYSDELGIYNKKKNPNWGGKRTGAGRPRQYVKVPITPYVERSEREQVTPESDLTICVAEADERQGIVIGDIWYGREEALAIARFIHEHL